MRLLHTAVNFWRWVTGPRRYSGKFVGATLYGDGTIFRDVDLRGCVIYWDGFAPMRFKGRGAKIHGCTFACGPFVTDEKADAIMQDLRRAEWESGNAKF